MAKLPLYHIGFHVYFQGIAKVISTVKRRRTYILLKLRLCLFHAVGQANIKLIFYSIFTINVLYYITKKWAALPPLFLGFFCA